jgi:hypothetical protein
MNLSKSLLSMQREIDYKFLCKCFFNNINGNALLRRDGTF